jgi:hypothetical protein
VEEAPHAFLQDLVAHIILGAEIIVIIYLPIQLVAVGAVALAMDIMPAVEEAVEATAVAAALDLVDLLQVQAVVLGIKMHIQ